MKKQKVGRQGSLVQKTIAVFLSIVLVGTMISIPAFASASAEEAGEQAASQEGTQQNEQQPTEEVVEGEESLESGSEQDTLEEEQTGQELNLLAASEEEENASTEDLSINTLDTATDITDLIVVDSSGTITAFHYNSSNPVKDIAIPAQKDGITITAIGANVFAGCQLESVDLQATAITNIGANAFSNNKDMSTLVLPSTLKTIDREAFCYCESLTSLSLPEGFTTLGGSAFAACTNLTTLTWPSTLTTNIGGNAFEQTGLTSVVIPEGVTSITEKLFFSCTKLTSVTLPDSLESIGWVAFGGDPIEEIMIPANVSSIDSGAFSGMSGKVIRLPHHLPNTIASQPWGATGASIYWKELENSCFWFDVDTQLITGLKPAGHNNCTHADWHGSTANLVVPKSIEVNNSDNTTTWYDVKGFVDDAFNANPNIVSVSFEEGSKVKTIAPRAFMSCVNLVSFELPESLERIEESAFQYAISLNSVEFPSSLTHIEQYAYLACPLSSVDFKEGLKYIGQKAFERTQLTTVELPSTMNFVGTGAFPTVKTATILGDSKTLVMEDKVFSETDICVEISLPARKEKSIGGQPWGAQYAKVKWMDENYGPEIIVTQDEEGNDEWHFNTVTNNLYKYVGKQGTDVEVTVPYSFTHEGTDYVVSSVENALMSGTTFSKMTIEEGYTNIYYNFAAGGNIKEVVLPEGITTLYQFAFYKSQVESVNLPESLETVGWYALGNNNLGEITLPKNVKTLSSEAFANNPNMKKVTLNEGLQDIGSNAFLNCGLTGTLTIPSSVTNIQNNSFSNNPDLTTIIVDMYRDECPYASLQPWGASNNTTVIYKGEEPAITSEVNPSTDTTGRARLIDLNAICEAGFPNITDVRVSTDGGSTSVSLMKRPGDDGSNPYIKQSNEIDLTFAATENATYTFYVKTAFSPSDDIATWYTHEVVIDDIGEMEIAAEDVELSLANAGKFSAADIIAASKVVATDLDSASTNTAGTEDNNFTFALSQDDLDAVNKLAADGDSCEVTLIAYYKDAYDLNEDVYKTSGFYNENGADGANHLQENGTYAYTNIITTKITVTLQGYTVSFDLNSGTPADDASATEYDDQKVGRGSKVLEPKDPQLAHYIFEGWRIASEEGEAWDFAANEVTADTLLVASWKPAEYDYSIEYYVENVLDTTKTVTGSAPYGTSITSYEDKCPVGYKLGTTSNIPFTITDDASNNVGKVYYIKDDAQVKDTWYTVNYYQDDTLVTDDSYRVDSTAWINDDPAMITVSNAIDSADDRYTGYALNTSRSSVAPAQGSKIASETVINLYYEKIEYKLTFDSQGANEAATLDNLELVVAFDTTIEAAPGFPAEPTKPGHYFRGWKMDNGSWLLADTKMPARDVHLTAVWEEGTVIQRGNITIVASDFSMTLAEARAHEAKTAAEQFDEIVKRGKAKAWFTDTKEDTPITLIRVVARDGGGAGRHIDAIAGLYDVTYYAGSGSDEVFVTPVATVVGENDIPPVTPPGTTTTPPEPVPPVIENIVEVLEAPIEAIFGPAEITIDENGTPLAGSHASCWVHWYMLLGGLVTLIYSAVAIARRLRSIHKLRAYEKEILGEEAASASQDKLAENRNSKQGAAGSLAQGMGA